MRYLIFAVGFATGVALEAFALADTQVTTTGTPVPTGAMLAGASPSGKVTVIRTDEDGYVIPSPKCIVILQDMHQSLNGSQFAYSIECYLKESPSP